MVLLICFLGVAKNLRYVQDNHFQKDELVYVMMSLGVVVLQWLVGTVLNPAAILYSFAGAVFQSQLPAFYVIFFSMLHIWMRARKALRNRSQSTRIDGPSIQLSDDNNSQGVDRAPKAPLSPRAQNNADEVEMLLDDAEDFEDFEKFLAKEFCTEELFFLQETQIFKREIIDCPEDKAIARAKRIYNKYIVDTSHLSVNISGENRKKLYAVFAEGQQLTKEIVEAAFDEAFFEVVCLVSSDKFRRYKHQSPHYKLKKAHRELHETLPIAPQAMEAPTSPTGSSTMH